MFYNTIYVQLASERYQETQTEYFNGKSEKVYSKVFQQTSTHESIQQ